MNKYADMQNRHQAAYNNFSKDKIFFAFSNEQFDDGLAKLGATADELTAIGAGGYIRTTDVDDFKRLLATFSLEQQAAIDGDADGTGFIYDMFSYELANHEYIVTGDVSETLDAIGLTENDIEQNPALKHGLDIACKEIMNGHKLPFVETTNEPETIPTNGLKMSEWHPEMLNGYVPKTTFWQDFSLAENFGHNAVKKTYNRAVGSWHDNVEYITELILCLNHKIWQHYETDEPLARVYDELYHAVDGWAWDTFTSDDDAAYMFKTLD